MNRVQPTRRSLILSGLGVILARFSVSQTPEPLHATVEVNLGESLPAVMGNAAQLRQVLMNLRWFGHDGGAPGMNELLRVYRDSGYVIAVLANLDPRKHSNGIGLLTRQSNIASQHQGNKQPDLVGEDEALGVTS